MRTRTLITLLLLSCICLSVSGRNTNRKVTLRQPDGTTISARIMGDEFLHAVYDSQGLILKQGSDGWWYYATGGSTGIVEATDRKAGIDSPISTYRIETLQPSQASIEKRTKVMQYQKKLLNKVKKASVSTKAADDVMKRNCIVLLVQFPNLDMTATREQFVNLLTEEGYSVNGARGSALDYFNDQFQGDAEFSFQISDILTLSQKYQYYFEDEDDITDIHAEEVVIEACKLAHDAGMDFSLADADGDGEVDNVFVFVAGKDEADGAGEDYLWSHMSYLEYYVDESQEYDGKIVNNYAMSTELSLRDDGSFAFTGIGTFCHEYSHTLGYCDLYDTDYDSSGGQSDGLWAVTALMDSGNMNDNSNCPPHYNAIDYYVAGLGNPETLKLGTYTLEPISENRRYLVMETDKKDEVFLFECRGNDGWDEGFDGSGLLIYHLDRSTNSAGYSTYFGSNLTADKRWEANEVNCNPKHECAKLVSATASLKAYSHGTFMYNQKFAFFPQSDVTTFSPTTDPAFTFWSGESSIYGLKDIAMDGDNVTFTVYKAANANFPEITITNTDVFQDAAIIQWETDDATYSSSAWVTVTYNGKETEYEVLPYEDGKYAITLEDLSPSSSYSVYINFRMDAVESKGALVDFTTKAKSNGYPYIFLNSVKRNSDGSFPSESNLPLRVFNAVDATSITWTFNGNTVKTGSNGYFVVTSSGELRATIKGKDGKEDIIAKQITVK